MPRHIESCQHASIEHCQAFIFEFFREFRGSNH